MAILNVDLKPAKFSDYISIAKLHTESWRQNYRGIYSDQFLNDEVEQNRLNAWRERLSASLANQFVTVAILNDEIVGFSCILINDDPVFGSLLDNLHVSSTVQNSGIGKLLMKACAKTILDKAINSKMYLWVYEANKNARAFYERMNGVCHETTEKQNEDGTYSSTCRYIWEDLILYTQL